MGTEAWLVVPFEIGNGVTLALMWASVASYVCLVTPQTFQATTLGLVGGLHFQLGHFFSAIIAGELITHAGFKAVWWIYAAFILLIGALYVVANTLLPTIESYEELEGDNGKKSKTEVIDETSIQLGNPAASRSQDQNDIPDSSIQNNLSSTEDNYIVCGTKSYLCDEQDQ